MKVTVQSAAGALDMELSEDMDMGTVGVLVQCELDGADVKLSALGCMLSDPTVTLGGLGIIDGEVIYAGDPPPDPWRQKWMEEMTSIKQNPYQLSIYKQNHPPLAEAVEKDDIDAFSQIVAESERSKRKRQADERRHRMILANDPFNIEAQRALESEIQLDNVEQLRQQAVEHMPESFAGGSITMLYISVVVNGIPLKAFVDSGAQMTIMSSKCAERCGMMRLVDTRFQGMAVGVGTQKIIGRVHMAQVQIEEAFLPTSFSILENQPMDMLLGLDMLKRHRCMIDLQENVLRIGTTNTTTRFLPESELPKKDDLSAPSDPDSVAPPAQGSGGGGSSGGGGGASFPEEAVQNLMSMGGFSREQVVGALTAAQGDPEVAAGFLLGS